MSTKNETRSIIAMALPLIAALLAQRGMQFIDTVMMGWLDPEALAAGALGTVFFITILLFCMGVLSVIGVFIVRAKGADNFADIKFTLQHGFYLALFLAVPCMILIWFICYWVLGVGGAYYLSMYTQLKAGGIWYGLTLGLGSTAIILMFRFFKKIKKEIVTSPERER